LRMGKIICSIGFLTSLLMLASNLANYVFIS